MNRAYNDIIFTNVSILESKPPAPLSNMRNSGGRFIFRGTGMNIYDELTETATAEDFSAVQVVPVFFSVIPASFKRESMLAAVWMPDRTIRA